MQTPHGTPLQSPIQRMFHEGDVPGALPPSRSHSVEDMAGAQRSGTMQATPGAIDQAHASMPGLPPIKAPPNVVTPDSGTTPREQVITPTASAFEAASQQQHLVDARTAQLASLAEQADLSGLEKALDALPLHEITGTVPGLTPPGFNTTELTAAAVNDVHKEIREGPRSPLRRADTPPDPRRALMRERRAAEWKQLSMPERDAVIVITAMCKMAARETGPGAAGTYLHTGKLLALDTLVKVLTNPAHDWGQVRPLFVEQLRQPLSSALLRNCSSPYDVAVAASVTIFSAILAAQRLREGLKAEVGALYPILLLRPLELERPDSPAQALAALSGLGSVCGSPHVLVDVFVNYDCSLQAANLFERSIKALARYVQLPPTGGPLPPADVPKARAAALKALLAAIKSMDTWAGPLKSPPESGNGSEAGATGGEGGNGAGTQSPHAAAQMAGRAPHQQDILERIHLDKALKSNLQGGIATFNVDPVKGIEVLVGSGAVGSSPGEVVAFLREQAANLDPTAVGELMGHHSERSIQVLIISLLPHLIRQDHNGGTPVHRNASYPSFSLLLIASFLHLLSLPHVSHC